MSTNDDVLVDFVNWWDGWDLYEDLPEDSQAFIDNFLEDCFPDWPFTISSKGVGVVL